MKYAYDLHIHSVLSPCADVLMTPHNIFNMAKIKGLDIISITDHNSCKQLEICEEISKSYDMLFVPGIEVTVKENFDVLCYFKTVEDAINFDQELEKYKVKETYDIEIFGDQEITNIYDEVVDTYPYLLTHPVELNINELINILKGYEHLMVFAHIDRNFRSGINYLDQITVDAVEYKFQKPEDNKHIYLFNSDAHQIIDLLEKKDKNSIEIEKLDINHFFRYFNHD